MKDLLDQNGYGHIKIFGGGGGTILPTEIDELQAYGITRIYSPDDGRKLGLEGMIEEVIQKSSAPYTEGKKSKASLNGHSKFVLDEWRDIKLVATSITKAENGEAVEVLKDVNNKLKDNSDGKLVSPVLGVTGTGGAGKSSVTDEIVRRFLNTYADKTIAVISVDPSRKKTGGALLGDRIRMNSIHHPRAYMRSLATRENDKALSNYVQEALDICKIAGYDFIILESAGVGQSDASILDYCDISVYVMTPEYGAASQLEKINMLDYADIVCINKFDKAGALDALHDVKKQYKRNHGLWNAKDGELPVIGTVASKFNDPGCNELFNKIIDAYNICIVQHIDLL
jgi:methylmalonyl-CoA mutase